MRILCALLLYIPCAVRVRAYAAGDRRIADSAKNANETSTIASTVTTKSGPNEVESTGENLAESPIESARRKKPATEAPEAKLASGSKSETNLESGSKSETNLDSGSKSVETNLESESKSVETNLESGAKPAETNLESESKSAETNLESGAKPAETNLESGAKPAETNLESGAKPAETNVEPSAAWLAVDKDSLCTVQTTRDYSCAQTHNFPKTYGTNEICIFKVLRAGHLTATVFHTESDFDVLNIDDKKFSGKAGPLREPVLPGSNITFHSDKSVNDTGFKICLGEDVENEGFILSPNSQCALSTKTGKNGKTVDPCVTSRNFPKNYLHGDECYIWTQKKGYLYFASFKTAFLDVLTITHVQKDGVSSSNNFSGNFHPASLQVVASSSITWKANSRNNDAGWEICLSPTQPEPYAPVASMKPLRIRPGFSIHVEEKWVDKFEVSLSTSQEAGVDVSCLVLHATQGVSQDFFSENNEILRKHILPFQANTLRFSQTLDGFSLSPTMYRVVCRGPDGELVTEVVPLKARHIHQHDVSRPVLHNALEAPIHPAELLPNGLSGYLLAVFGMVGIFFCASRVVKWCRGTRQVGRVEYEMTSPAYRAGMRADGYVPPQVVGYSGDVI